ncbi:MAG: YciI family protein [Kofleriaceae bacterium]
MATKETEARRKPPTNDELLAMHKFNEELEKAGVLLELGGLAPSSEAVRIRFEGKNRSVIDGPFAEAKEMVAGYSIIQVKSREEAIEWAKRSPFGTDVHRDDTVEVVIRRLMGPEDYEPEMPGKS